MQIRQVPAFAFYYLRMQMNEIWILIQFNVDDWYEREIHELLGNTLIYRNEQSPNHYLDQRSIYGSS